MKNLKKFNDEHQYQYFIDNGVITPNILLYKINNKQIVDYNIKQDLPMKYKQLEYIESTGSQYILFADLFDGYHINNTTDYGFWDAESIYKIQIKYYVPAAAQAIQAALFGMMGDNCPTLYYNDIHGVYWKFPTASKDKWQAISPSTTNYNYKMSDYDTIGEGEMIYQCQNSESKYRVFAPILFARHGADNTQLNIDRIIKAKLYYFKMYKNDELIIDLIPCKSNKDEIGLYNNVNKKFVKSHENTPFVAGPTI